VGNSENGTEESYPKQKSGCAVPLDRLP